MSLTPADQVRLRQTRRQAGAGIPVPSVIVPDEELINTLVALGQPRHDALELRHNPQLRLAAMRLWVDVGDAGRGDPAAKDRVDYVRATFAAMRHEELISDEPGRNHGELVDPHDLL